MPFGDETPNAALVRENPEPPAERKVLIYDSQNE
jgi:hypothetical protein